MKINLTFFIILYLSSAVAIAFPKNNTKPGGVAIIAVAPSTSSKPFVSYHSKPVALVLHQYWFGGFSEPESG